MWKATDIVCGPFVSEFNIRYRTADLGRFTLRIPGRHNVLNAMAAIAVAMELEVDPEAIRQGLATFSGVDRRFQMRGKEQGITVVDDYGHHPTEIRATLDGARVCGFRKIHVLFQPHRYSRTYHLMDEFARSFMQADSVFCDGYLRGFGEADRRRDSRIAGRPHTAVRPSWRGICRSLDRGADALVKAAGEDDWCSHSARETLAGRRKSSGTSACGRAELMAREPRSKRSRTGRINWRLTLGILAVGAVGVSTAMAGYKVSQYAWPTRNSLLSHERKDSITILGLTYASRWKVQRVFAGDFDRSIFPCRWPSAAAACWPSTGWKTPRSPASGRTAW
jgi:hypothetical protein